MRASYPSNDRSDSLGAVPSLGRSKLIRPPDRDAELSGLVGDIITDASAEEDKNAHPPSSCLQGDTVHRADASHHPRPADRELRGTKADSVPGDRWDDVARIRGGSDGAGRGALGCGAVWPLPGAAVATRLQTEAKRQTASSGHRGTGRQNRPAGGSDGAERDLRRGLPRVLVWVPARAQPTSSSGRALDRTAFKKSELGA